MMSEVNFDDSMVEHSGGSSEVGTDCSLTGA